MATPLENLRLSLAQLVSSVERFEELITEEPDLGIIYHPPILASADSSSSSSYAGNGKAQEAFVRNELTGMSRFKSSCEKELSLVESMLKSPSPPEDLPSTNSPYLLSHWREVLAAEGPLWAINRLYVLPSADGRAPDKDVKRAAVRSSDQVKVDLVSRGGKEWVKVNTMKLSRLMSEFHEQDALLCDDWDSDDSDSQPSSSTPEFPFSPVNSLTKQAYGLTVAARLHPLASGQLPHVALRLPRMSTDDLERDPRVGQTFDAIRAMGVDLRLGELPDTAIAEAEARREHTLERLEERSRLRISSKLNLDLSLLIALISDITHAPLPTTLDEADKRFQPIAKTWKRKVDQETGEVSAVKLDGEEMGAEEHTRALGVQLRQEMESRLVEDLENQLRQAMQVEGTSSVELWTTTEAKTRCEDIVSKIGGRLEKQRTRAMFAGNDADFWEGSRYEGNKGPLATLNIQLFDESVPAEPLAEDGESSPFTFRKALKQVCETLLNPDLSSFTNFQQVPLEALSLQPRRKLDDLESGSTSVSVDSTDSEAPTSYSTSAAPRVRSKNKKPPKAAETARIPTSHTIRSMLEGAVRGMTTVTANRMSVKQMVRALGPLEGLEDDLSGVATLCVVEPKTLAESKRSDVQPKAAIWSIEPRSLAETLRADYEAVPAS